MIEDDVDVLGKVRVAVFPAVGGGHQAAVLGRDDGGNAEELRVEVAGTIKYRAPNGVISAVLRSACQKGDCEQQQSQQGRVFQGGKVFLLAHFRKIECAINFLYIDFSSQNSEEKIVQSIARE